jgi:XRE family transcriptional regulator, aerobic/anaerobic benzoate catabolism transcriptional regulator
MQTMDRPLSELERNARPGLKPGRADGDALAAAVGRLVRISRAKRGMTRRALAHASGASERYLAQIEGGEGNPSVVILNAIANALDVPIVDLLPGTNARPVAMARVLDLLGRVPAAELPKIAELIEARTGGDLASDRVRRIALIGLRGAGKSTLGRRLADELGFSFIELDRLVEQDYGARIPDLIEMAGLATFRRYERACLERVIKEQEAAVIATAGGIVSNAETFALLLRRTHTVWIKARPDEHMRRVMQQGDFRPMAKNRAAMADLVAILDARTPDYARARAELDTSGDTVERSFEKLLQIVRRCLGDPSAVIPRECGESSSPHVRKRGKASQFSPPVITGSSAFAGDDT